MAQRSAAQQEARTHIHSLGDAQVLIVLLQVDLLLRRNLGLQILCRPQGLRQSRPAAGG